MMKKLFNNKHNVIIMDNTDCVNLWGIIGKISDFLKTGNEMFISQLDNDHPSITVVRYKISRRKNKELQKSLDRFYPELCAYDAIV